MKKAIFLLLSFLTTIFLSVFPSYAQTYVLHQRLGIPAQQTIYLTAKNPSKELEAFCLDRHKIIDGTYDYSYVLASDNRTTVTVGRRTLSLQKAIDEKLIKVESLLSRADFGSGIGLRFVRLKNLPVAIRVRDSIAMGETPGTFDNLPVLTSLRKAKPNVENGSKVKQDKIWEADIDRSRLESLGYNSVEEFQREKNLPLNSFDNVTKTKLKEVEDKLIARFEAVGLNDSRSDTSIKSVSDNIGLFEIFVLRRKINVTRVFSSDIRQRFEKYERFVKIDYPIIKELKGYNTDLGSSLVLRVKSEIGKENFYTIYSHLGKEYEGNSISEINALVSKLSQGYEDINLDLDFPSPKMMAAFKNSFETRQIKSSLTFSKGTTATKKVFFSNTKSFEIDSITEPILENGDYSQTIGLKSPDAADINKSWKIKAASKIKETVVKFTDAFKTIFAKREKQSIANIIGKARRAASAMPQNENKTDLEITISFIDEFGEIQTGKIFFGKSNEIAAE